MAEAEWRRHWVLHSAMEKEKRCGPSSLMPFNRVVFHFWELDPWELNTVKSQPFDSVALEINVARICIWREHVKTIANWNVAMSLMLKEGFERHLCARKSAGTQWKGFTCLRLILYLAMVVYDFNCITGEAKADKSLEFQASLFYLVSSRPVRVIKGDPVSRKKQKQKNEKAKGHFFLLILHEIAMSLTLSRESV